MKKKEKENSSDICRFLVNVNFVSRLKKKKKSQLVPDIAAIVSHIVHQPNVATPRGDILMSGRTHGDKQNTR